MILINGFWQQIVKPCKKPAPDLEAGFLNELLRYSRMCETRLALLVALFLNSSLGCGQTCDGHTER